MKELFAAVIVTALIIGVFFVLKNVNVNRLGADSYYLQITESGNEIEGKISTGDVIIRYEYALPAFNEEGNEKALTFRSRHVLRQNAYLELFLKDGKGITSYREVKKKEVPEKALEKLN